MSHLTNDQHGFKKGLSTETQHLRAVHDWCHTQHKGCHTDDLSHDFSRAYDSVSHSRHPEKMRYCDISGKTKKVSEGLLRNRRQKVVINGSSFHWALVAPGVPQGTVTGPIVCLIYINDTQVGDIFKNEIVYWWIRRLSRHKLPLRTHSPQRWPHQTWLVGLQVAHDLQAGKGYVISIPNKIHVSNFQYCLRDVPLQSVSPWPHLSIVTDSKLIWTPPWQSVECGSSNTCSRSNHAPRRVWNPRVTL